MSSATAAGLPRITMSMSFAWRARGQGQGILSSANESSSMVMMTTGALGVRGPRSANCPLSALSSLFTRKPEKS